MLFSYSVLLFGTQNFAIVIGISLDYSQGNIFMNVGTHVYIDRPHITLMQDDNPVFRV
jgi:hypothetical protein